MIKAKEASALVQTKVRESAEYRCRDFEPAIKEAATKGLSTTTVALPVDRFSGEDVKQIVIYLRSLEYSIEFKGGLDPHIDISW